MPARFAASAENVATPEAAATVLVPLMVALPLGVVAIAVVQALSENAERLTLRLEVVTVFPWASCTRSTGCAESADPAVAVLEGAVEKASFVADPAEILKAELVAEVNVPEVAVRVYPVPDLSMLRPVKLAWPEAAFIVAVPESVPAPGFVPIARVMLAVEVVTVFPFAS